MSLNEIPSSQRIHISFFGLVNSGKSSLVNRLTNQEMSMVSDKKGTTTDPVKKSMELLPLGPVVIVDTPGFDDDSSLGEKRMEKARQILSKIHIAVLVSEAGRELNATEKELLGIFTEKNIPFVIAKNKSDLYDGSKENKCNEVFVSALLNEGIETLKEKIASIYRPDQKEIPLVSDLVSKGDIVVLVIPIDSSAPKGRIILPQQMAIRDILDKGAVCVMTKEDEYASVLENLKDKVSLVICDSQIFSFVDKNTPESIYLTSFSVLMARKNGFLETAVSGAKTLSELKDGDKILVCEGCTHHRQCEDIGTVKLPKWIREYTKKDVEFEFTQGSFFPKDLSPYSLIVHCGGCMITPKEVMERMKMAKKDNVPFTNYGTLIAHINGILDRSTEML